MTRSGSRVRGDTRPDRLHARRTRPNVRALSTGSGAGCRHSYPKESRPGRRSQHQYSSKKNSRAPISRRPNGTGHRDTRGRNEEQSVLSRSDHGDHPSAAYQTRAAPICVAQCAQARGGLRHHGQEEYTSGAHYGTPLTDGAHHRRAQARSISVFIIPRDAGDHGASHDDPEQSTAPRKPTTAKGRTNKRFRRRAGAQRCCRQENEGGRIGSMGLNLDASARPLSV